MSIGTIERDSGCHWSLAASASSTEEERQAHGRIPARRESWHPMAGDEEEVDGAAEIVRKLRKELEEHRRRCARRAGWDRWFVPTGLVSLDDALPHGGLPCGAVTEILADGYGVGIMSLAMRIVARCNGVGRAGTRKRACPSALRIPAATYQASREPGQIPSEELERRLETGAPQHEETWRDQRRIVLVDIYGDFYPPAVLPYGISLDQLIVIRPRSETDAFWAMDQSLRCPGVAVVIAPLRRLDRRLSRRLQLAAESSGCLGLVLRSADRRTKSFAAVQMLLEDMGGERLDGDDRGLTSISHTPVASPLVDDVVDDAPRDGAPPTGGDATRRLAECYGQAPILRDAHPCRITLLKVREGTPAGPLTVDLHHETGAWPVHPVPLDRPVAQRA